MIRKLCQRLSQWASWFSRPGSATLRFAITVSALLVTSCAAVRDPEDSRVHSEKLYLYDRPALQTCWVTEPSPGRFSLNSYFFYYYEQDSDAPCPKGLPSDQLYYRFNQQARPELAIDIIENLKGWLANNPDLSFLSEVSECRSESDRSLDIGLISFPAITRASDIYVDFAIYCPAQIRAASARLGFSYGETTVETFSADEKSVLWR